MRNTKEGALTSARGTTLGMAVIQMLKGCLSLVLVLFSASLFGAGIERDAWVIGWGIQVLIFKLLFGPVNEIFRARFLQLKEEQGEQFALNSALSLAVFFVLIAGVVIGLFFIADSDSISLLVPGYTDAADKQVIAGMLRLLIPTLVLSELISLFTALLNSYRSFYLPELFGMVSLALNIVLLYFLSAQMGIYTLVLANYISAAALTFLLLYFAWKHKLFPSLISIRFASIVPYLLFSAPLYLLYTAGQLAGWLERVLVSYLAVGNTSALDYARKFIDLPITVIIAVGSTVMTPLLAGIWVQEKNSGLYQKEFFAFLRMGLLIIAPIVMLFCICPFELIELLLHRGRFAAEWIGPTAQTLFWFGLGLVGVVVYVISGQSLLVQKKSAWYAGIGIGAQILPVLINFLFLKEFGLPVFGLSWCIAQYCGGIILFFIAQPASTKTEMKGLLKIMAILAISTIAAALIKETIRELPILFRIVLVTFTDTGIILLLLFLWRTEEFHSIKKAIFRRSI